MSDSVGSAIAKIKLEEQKKDAILKVKREYESNISLLQRNIRDVLYQKEKLYEEEKDLNQRIQKLAPQLEIERIKNKSLQTQIEVLKKELEDLKKNIDLNISNVWELRSSYCDVIKKTSDDYDVRALLMKPVHTEPMPRNRAVEKETFSNESIILQAAIERRERAIAQRDRLLAEPDNGEEFVRLKNALQYNVEMIANLTKDTELLLEE